MQRPSESVVPFELAREIATREGAKAVLDGEIVRLGQSYVVSARLVSALDGQELATFRETAENEDALIGALGELSRAIREKAGESLRTIRASSRAGAGHYAVARRAPEVRRGLAARRRSGGDRTAGSHCSRRRWRWTPAFAMAWRKIAVLLGNEERDRSRARRRHRHRVPAPGAADRDGAPADRGVLLHPRPPTQTATGPSPAYEEAIRLDSTNTSALNNAAVIYGEKRDYERAEELYRRVTGCPAPSAGPSPT